MNENEREEGVSKALAIVRRAWEEAPFNRLLGLRIDRVGDGEGRISFVVKPELIGNFHQGILHGGVISAVLDTTGGLTACASALGRMKDLSPDEATHRMARMGTIDLRVDYLRPGKGKEFRCVGTVMRTGRKVAVTRMELFDQGGTLIAVGTGAYLVG
jgi:uncharacterized protein (TIGR00369 family)